MEILEATESDHEIWSPHSGVAWMQQHVLGEFQRLILSALGGSSLFLLAVLVYTRLTAYDPFLISFLNSGSTAKAMALLHLTALLAY